MWRTSVNHCSAPCPCLGLGTQQGVGLTRRMRKARCASPQLKINHSPIYLFFTYLSFYPSVTLTEETESCLINKSSCLYCGARHAPKQQTAGPVRLQQQQQGLPGSSQDLLQPQAGEGCAFHCSHENKRDACVCFLNEFIIFGALSKACASRPLPTLYPPRCSLRRRSYLQPGGEREWKVERENISALSAIFFHK